MTEQVMGVPPVEEQVESVTQQPAVTPDDDTAALRRKLELVQQDNQAKGEANKRLNERLGEIEKSLRDAESRLKSGQQQQLANQGEFKKLWEDANADNARLQQRIAELEAALEAKDAEAANERLRATALQQIAGANALAPEQLLGLLQPQLRNADNGPAVIVNGIEQPLNAYLTQLRNPGSGWEHHFAPTGTRGMGSAPSANGLPGVKNPFKAETFNLTEVLRLEAENPDLAKALKAEAGRG
jgi:multidrug efflux pump subunit AcrA (membrane-fusion protein)